MTKARLVGSVFAVFLILAGLTYAQETTAQPAAQDSSPTAAAVQQPAPATQQAAPAHLFAGAKVFIEDRTEFGMALGASFIEKKVPLTVVANAEKADFTIRTVSEDRKASTAAKVFMVGRDRWHATVSIFNRDGILVFAYNVKKNTFQDAANSTANEIKHKGIQQ
jgi:hypothetical protein